MKSRTILLATVLVFILGCATETKFSSLQQSAGVPENVTAPDVPDIPVEQPAEEQFAEEPPLNHQENQEDTEPETNTVEETPILTEIIEEPKPCGSFFDAYTRITGGPQDSSDVLESELASLLAARMKEHDVGCAVLVGIDVTDFDTPQEIKDSISYYSSILKLYPGTFMPFLDLDTESSSDYTTARVQQILNEAEGKIDYKGFGEISFVDPGPWNGKKLTDKPLPELVQFFGGRNMVVAAHIERGQTLDLKAILTQYPNTKILVHGYPDGIKDLLVKHKNLYYAAELEIMAADGTYSCSSISSSASDVESTFQLYGPIIAAAPNQVLWATNAHSKCHFQPGFYGKLIEFSEKFVEKLPEEQQDKFAWKNAERLLRER